MCAFRFMCVPVHVCVGMCASLSVRSPSIVKITHDKCRHIFALHYLKEVREKREWKVEERGGGVGGGGGRRRDRRKSKTEEK